MRQINFTANSSSGSILCICSRSFLIELA